MKHRRRRRNTGLKGLVCGTILTNTTFAARPSGDVDNDGSVTLQDLVKQIAAARGQLALSESDWAFADANHDGVLNDYDSEAIVRTILGAEPIRDLPAARVLDTSPSSGESGVPLTREFVL